jgi:transcriptional regulator of heat shock response
MSEDRRKKVLKEIIKHFIETGEPVGSKTLIVSYNFSVSPATIRNDMMELEREGLIFQPHISAGRVPTDKAYRLFINEMADFEKARIDAIKKLEEVTTEYQVEKLRQHLFDAVQILSRATCLASFATTPDNPHTFFLGMSNMLKQPEFSHDLVRASEVFEVLEKGDNFVNTLKSLEIDHTVKTFIGEENIIPQIQSCSIVVTRYFKDGLEGYLGVLGPKRMNYPFNIVMIEEIKKLFK